MSINTLEYDLGQVVSDDCWVCRFRYIAEAQLGNQDAIGLFSSSSDANVSMDSICLLMGTSPSGFHIQSTDGAVPADGTTGDGSFTYTPNLTSNSDQEHYVEIKRTSRTTYEVALFHDRDYLQLIERQTGTCSSGLTGLQFLGVKEGIQIGNRAYRIREVEFYNDVDTVPIKDEFTPRIRWADDMSTTISQNFPASGTGSGFSKSGGVMNWDVSNDGNNGISQEIASKQGESQGFITPEANRDEWTLRFKLTIDNLTQGSSTNSNSMFIGLCEQNSSVSSAVAKDFIGLRLKISDTLNEFSIIDTDGTAPSGATPDATFTTVPSVGDIYVEIKRTTETTYEVNLFSDADFLTLIESESGTCPSTLELLVNNIMQNDPNGGAGTDHVLDGSIDDWKVYDQPSVTAWAINTGTDVNINTEQKRVDFDIPSGVQRDELVTLDLQSTSIGENASDSNWVLRFQIDTDSITQGSSEESASLFVGLDDGLLSARTTGHDFIAFGVVIDQGGAGPAFGATTTLRTGDSADYFTGAVGANFPIMWTTGTLYVEVKRLSPILAEATIYSDADFTEVFTTPQQVTIASTLDNLRYIRITTDSSAVANDNPWDGAIKDVCFFNKTSVTVTPVEETNDFEDKFVADNWTNISGTKVGVNTTTQVIDWTSSVSALYNEGEFNDILGKTISTNKWALRFKLDVTASSIGIDGTANSLFVGFSDDNTGTPEAVQDYIGLQIFRQATGNTGSFRLMGVDGTAPNLTAGTDTTLIPTVGTYYIEIRRTGTIIDSKIYSDPDYSILLESVSETLEVGVTGLRYLKVMVSNRDGSGDHTFDGTIDDMKFWDGKRALTHENVWRTVG